MDRPRNIKVVLLGDSTVGKTSFAFRMKTQHFIANVQPTIGCEFFSHSYTKDDVTIKFMIWDTAGQEVFRSFTPQFSRGADIALLLFDLTCSDTFTSINSWLDTVPIGANVIVVPTKLDLAPAPSVNPDLSGLSIYGHDVVCGPPISSKTGENCEELLLLMFDIGIKRIMHLRPDTVKPECLTNDDGISLPCCRP